MNEISFPGRTALCAGSFTPGVKIAGLAFGPSSDRRLRVKREKCLFPVVKGAGLGAVERTEQALGNILEDQRETVSLLYQLIQPLQQDFFERQKFILIDESLSSHLDQPLKALEGFFL